jgi:ribonucleoside-diphosphate reductase alpha chain
MTTRRRARRGLDRNEIAQRFFTEASAMGMAERDLVEEAIGLFIARHTLPGFEVEAWPEPQPAQVHALLREVQARKASPAPAPSPRIVLKEEPVAQEKLATKPHLELSQTARSVLERRYLAKDSQGKAIETVEDMFRRVARNIAQAELNYNPKADAGRWEEEFYRLMTSLEFLPNSPTLMNAGRELQQLSACFVIPIEDSMESIFDAVKYTALIHKSGGGTGFSFSRLRPEKDKVGSTGEVASGPVSFMRAFDTATEVIKQGGKRRGANMGILLVTHPDILKFVTAKAQPGAFTNFNLSVAVTRDFIEKATKGEEYDLINPRDGQAAGRLNARAVLDKIIEMAWKTGDPGIVFIDRINESNPTPQLGQIESTNPCGEQPLLPFESCNLGSINLARMLKERDGSYEIDWEKLGRTIDSTVRFLDNVIDMNRFPVDQIAKRTRATRKIGLGVMGFADLLIRLGISYDSEEALRLGEKVMAFLSEKAIQASEALGRERGTFPAFKGSIYDRAEMPQVRNATRTTIAPTGTLSIIANCSSGIEPLYALSYVRNILDNEQFLEVHPIFEEVAKKEGLYSPELMAELAGGKSLREMKGIPEKVKRAFATAHDITPEWHVKMQAAFQRHTDNAVSKTVNLPHTATPEDVRQVFFLAYKEGLKGITIYRDRSKGRQVLATPQAEAPEARPTLQPRPRPKVTRQGYSEKVTTGCGNLYVMVNSDERGICDVFASLGHAGGCASAQLEAIGRLISVALRSGLELPSVIKMVKGIRCPNIAWEEGHAVLSCADAIGSVLERYQGKRAEPQARETQGRAEARPVSLAGQCPDCGGMLIYQEGCFTCRACGYTKCS